jgi:parallel beta helix pectate lyase-like protein
MKIAVVLSARPIWAKLCTLGVISGFLALCPDIVSAADRTVKRDGSGNFTTIQACANAVQPGETCLVYPGDYPEHPQTARGGTSGNYITFKAVAGAPVTTKGFRIRHPYVRIEGFDITKYAVGSDQAHIRVEPEGDYCQIVNNVIRDGVYLSSTGFLFDGPSKTITNPAGGFIAAGFAPGASIYIGSDINNQILNHDNAKTIPHTYETKILKAVSDTTLTLIDTNTVFTEGPVPSTIYVNSAEKNGMWGIIFISSTTRGVADTCLIQGNRFSNLAGKALQIYGNNHVVERNTFERMNGWRMLTFVGNNHVVRYNVFRNSPRWPGFSLPKTPLAAQGSGTWDMYDVLFASFGEQADNNIIEYNYIENIDEQFSNIAEQGARGLIIRNNIFVGYEMTGGISRPDTQIVHNTFYKTAWGGNSHHNFNLARSTVHGNPVGSFIKNNAFIETAKAADPTSGWYSTMGPDGLPTAGVSADYNFVTGTAGAAKTGFQAFGLETHGVNGGNPLLRNVNNLLGPDGIPFTVDDGLKPLSTSPLCGKGEGSVDIGAYSCDPLKVFAEGNSVPLPTVPPTAPTNLRILR